MQNSPLSAALSCKAHTSLVHAGRSETNRSKNLLLLGKGRASGPHYPVERSLPLVGMRYHWYG